MIDADFSAYVQGLPPEDRRTVEQALLGMRRCLEPEAISADIILLCDVVREDRDTAAA
jgi:hypothetical protein